MGKVEEDLDNECPLVGSKGDKLIVNHGLIASANMCLYTFFL